MQTLTNELLLTLFVIGTYSNLIYLMHVTVTTNCRQCCLWIC